MPAGLDLGGRDMAVRDQTAEAWCRLGGLAQHNDFLQAGERRRKKKSQAMSGMQRTSCMCQESTAGSG